MSHSTAERAAGGAAAARGGRLVVALHAPRSGFFQGEEAVRSVRRAVRPGADAAVVDVTDVPAVRDARRAAGAGAAVEGAGPSPAAEAEALRIARAAGAARAVVVEVEALEHSFSLPLLPVPGWAVQSRVAYSVRAFDVPTGQKVLETRRYRKHGGLFALSVPNARRQFEQALRHDLRGLLPPAGAPEQRRARRLVGVDLLTVVVRP